MTNSLIIDEELLYLSRSNFSTSMQTKGIKGGRVYNPYAFTEEGVYMPMTVLKGGKAVKQSKILIRLFKKYIKTNRIIYLFVSLYKLYDGLLNNLKLKFDTPIPLDIYRFVLLIL